MERSTRTAVTAALLTAALAAALAAAGTPPSATAAPAPVTWGPVTDLALSRSTSRPDVVLAPDGTTTVVWRTVRAVVALQRGPGGRWGDPHRLGHGTAPQVGVDGTGTVTAVWTRHRPGWGPQVVAARKVPGHAWSRPFPVSAAVPSEGSPAHGAFTPQLAVGHGGAVVVCWLSEADDSGASRVQARYRPAGHRWLRTATLSPVEARSPVCAVGEGGHAVVVYTVFARAYAVLRARHGWARRHEVGRHVEPPQVAMDDAGDVAAVWSALQPDGVFRPQAVTRRAGGRWTAPRTLDRSATAAPVTLPTVSSGPRGRVTAAWTASDGRVLARVHPREGPWSAVAEVAAAPGTEKVRADGAPLDLTTGRSGAVLLAWTRREAGGGYLEAAYRPPRRGWGAPVRLSPTGLDAAAAEVSIGARGRAVATWRGLDAAGSHTQLRWRP